MAELFMYGDPRLLSGGDGVNQQSRNSYEYLPPTVGHGTTTAELEARRCDPEETPFELASACGQQIHRGKSSYHSTPTYNNFLVAGQWPSAGIELETIMSERARGRVREALDAMRSNWFHFERDGSLDDEHNGEYGYELITEPLPPRVYRDPETWTGLENAVSPWLESFGHAECGLHIHVGTCQFAECEGIPLRNPDDRIAVGKALACMVYYHLAGQALVDRVTLRKSTEYCSPTANGAFTRPLASGKMTGAEFVDTAVSRLLEESQSAWADGVDSVLPRVGRGSYPTPHFVNSVPQGLYGHHTEINAEHKYTLEFRRGKGTVHALSIHRMVELMTGIVRFAGKCCREPDAEVSRAAFLDFMSRTTTSEVLRKMIEKKGGTQCA